MLPIKMYTVQVRLPNSVIMEGEFEKNVSGRECLENFCRRLGIYETDFFGLKRIKKGSSYWLFLRRPLFDQISKFNARILLCIKFFVRPSELQQITTKRMFYHEIKAKLRSGEIRLQGPDLAKAGALMCILENLASEVRSGRSGVLSQFFPEECWDSGLVWGVDQELVALERLTQADAIRSFLELTSGASGYGVYTFVAQSENDRDAFLTLGFGAVSLCDMKTQVILNKMQMSDIMEITYTENKLGITSKVSGAKGVPLLMYVKVGCRRQSREIFRTLTEHHVYFYQSKVAEDILYHRYKPSRLGLDRGSYFMFDVIRTREESYAFHWTRLHRVEDGEMTMQDSLISCPEANRTDALDDLELDNSELRDSTGVQMNDSSLDITQLDGSRISPRVMGPTGTFTNRKRGKGVREEHCKICYTNRVKTVFCPCGHSVCCISCSKRITACPICRKDVAHKQTIFNS